VVVVVVIIIIHHVPSWKIYRLVACNIFYAMIDNSSTRMMSFRVIFFLKTNLKKKYIYITHSTNNWSYSWGLIDRLPPSIYHYYPTAIAPINSPISIRFNIDIFANIVVPYQQIDSYRPLFAKKLKIERHCVEEPFY